MRQRLEELVGQLLFLRLRENRWNASLERLLRNAAPGGILLSAPLPPSAKLTNQLLRNIVRAIPHSPFLAAREEGGRAGPLEAFLPRLPTPHAAAGKGLPDVTRLGELIGEALRRLGFNTNFAPRLDLAAPLSEKGLGAREFGSDPKRVAECGGAFLRGQRRAKVLAVGKHFPGEGSVPQGNPRRLAVSGKPMAALWQEDLLPFRQLLPQLEMVLISSAAYKAYDFDQPRPACLSPLIVEGLLRVKLGFRGLALGYDLESVAARGGPELGEAAVRAIDAGCDMLIVDEGKPFDDTRCAFERGLATGKLDRQRVEQSLERIQAVMRRLPEPPDKIGRRDWGQLVRRFQALSSEFG